MREEVKYRYLSFTPSFLLHGKLSYFQMIKKIHDTQLKNNKQESHFIRRQLCSCGTSIIERQKTFHSLITQNFF